LPLKPAEFPNKISAVVYQRTSKPILLGGSRSDHWNQTLCNQIIKRGWFRENIPDAEQQDQYTATCAFPASVKPADAVEGGLNRGYVQAD
jgi:hypothetical protein